MVTWIEMTNFNETALVLSSFVCKSASVFEEQSVFEGKETFFFQLYNVRDSLVQFGEECHLRRITTE